MQNLLYIYKHRYHYTFITLLSETWYLKFSILYIELGRKLLKITKLVLPVSKWWRFKALTFPVIIISETLIANKIQFLIQTFLANVFLHQSF